MYLCPVSLASLPPPPPEHRASPPPPPPARLDPTVPDTTTSTTATISGHTYTVPESQEWDAEAAESMGVDLEHAALGPLTVCQDEAYATVINSEVNTRRTNRTHGEREGEPLPPPRRPSLLSTLSCCSLLLSLPLALLPTYFNPIYLGTLSLVISLHTIRVTLQRLAHLAHAHLGYSIAVPTPVIRTPTPHRPPVSSHPDHHHTTLTCRWILLRWQQPGR